MSQPKKPCKMKYDLTLYLGLKGSGKTSVLAKLSLYYSTHGHKVYSNVILPGADLFDLSSLCDPFVPEEGSLVIIDEAGLVMDNRSFKEFKKTQLAYFKLQRHLKNKVIIASQSLDFDKKVRTLLDQIVYLKKILWWTYSRPLTTYLHVNEDPQGESSECNICIAYKWKSIFEIHFYFLPSIWHKFNSFSLEQLPPQAKSYIENGYN